MTKRRTLDDALSPEQEAFLETGKGERTPDVIESQPMTSPQAAPFFTPGAPLTLPPNLAGTGLVPFNVRIDPAISQILFRASIERKMQRLIPFSQRDIVAEALLAWLKANGY